MSHFSGGGADQSRVAMIADENVHRCICLEIASKTCACKQVFYCSAICQNADSKMHKETCSQSKSNKGKAAKSQVDSDVHHIHTPNTTPDVASASSAKGGSFQARVNEANAACKGGSEFDIKVDHLLLMFGHFDRESVAALLLANNESLEETASILLETPAPTTFADNANETARVKSSSSLSAAAVATSTAKDNQRTDFIANLEKHLTCPITDEIFLDPVVTKYGSTYEREAILTWLRSKQTDPTTQQPLSTSDLATNYAIKSIVDEFRKLKS